MKNKQILKDKNLKFSKVIAKIINKYPQKIAFILKIFHKNYQSKMKRAKINNYQINKILI